MTRMAATSSPTAHGATPLYPDFGALYETRHGRFGGGRVLWDDGEPPPPTPPTPAPADPPAPTGTDALNRALAGLLSRHGSSDAVALHLLNENHALREQRRTLQGQVPAQGTVVLTPEQAAQWQAYQQLGTDPAALATRLTDGTAALEREQGRTLAEASGANPAVLTDLLRQAGLRAEVREVPATATAPATRAVHVLDAQGADQGELRTWATQHRAAYVPALFPPAATPVQGTVITPQAGAGQGTVPATNAWTPAPSAAPAAGAAAPAAAPVIHNPFDFSKR